MTTHHKPLRVEMAHSNNDAERQVLLREVIAAAASLGYHVAHIDIRDPALTVMQLRSEPT